jgi:hypothetical protein
MALDLRFILAFYRHDNPHAVAVIHADLPLHRDNGFVKRLRKFAEKNAQVLPTKLQTISLVDGEHDITTTDAYMKPLTYLRPQQLDRFEDDHPQNQAALDYVRYNQYRLGLIIVLYWE